MRRLEQHPALCEVVTIANREFIYWCKDAISGIRYWKIRNKVFSELYEHLEDRYEHFLSKGYEPKEAEKKTLEAMGDPCELAPQLAAIHKPHWDYAAVVTRVLAWALVVVTLCRGVAYFCTEGVHPYSGDVWDPFDEGGEECVAFVEPDIIYRESGYTFRLEKAALWRTYHTEPTEAGEEYFDSLYISMKVSHILPWMREQQAVGHMWAVDNNGVYYRSNWSAEGGEPFVRYVPKFRWFNNATYEFSFYDTVTDLQWIELHYDRDGRDMVFRVDLTGGDTK